MENIIRLNATNSFGNKNFVDYFLFDRAEREKKSALFTSSIIKQFLSSLDALKPEKIYIDGSITVAGVMLTRLKIVSHVAHFY